MKQIDVLIQSFDSPVQKTAATLSCWWEAPDTPNIPAEIHTAWTEILSFPLPLFSRPIHATFPVSVDPPSTRKLVSISSRSGQHRRLPAERILILNYRISS